LLLEGIWPAPEEATESRSDAAEEAEGWIVGIVSILCAAFSTMLSPQAFTMRSRAGFVLMKLCGISTMTVLMLRPACASLPL